MSAQREIPNLPPLDLGRWRAVPTWFMAIGGIAALVGVLVPSLRMQFAYSWLLAFMFYLSICLGAFFMVLVHHLFDASWSVAIRRFEEHIACLVPVLAVLFIPIAVLAPILPIYPWMKMSPSANESLAAKQPLFTIPMFYVVAAVCFFGWWLITSRLRAASLRQDETGAVQCTHSMRAWAAAGIFFYALSLTIAAFMWMQAVQHEWYSTMYGVYFFAGAVWTSLATIYAVTVALQRSGPLREVVHEETYYFIGSLLLAFTVFYAYIHFAQYFIIWNANVPEETFWYVVREKGTWWDIGMVIIFGHFFLPFLMLLRIDWKLKLPVMLFLAAWAWAMQFVDLSFNIMPALHPNGFVLHWLDVACMTFMCGVLIKAFTRSWKAHPPFPLRDPRFAETLKVYVAPSSAPSEPFPARGGGH